MTRITLASTACIAALLAASVAFGQEPPAPEAGAQGAAAEATMLQEPMLQEPSVSFAEAAAIANGAAEGQLVAMALDYVTETPAYIAEFYGETGDATVAVDGLTGEVIFSQIAQGADAETYELFAEALAMDDMDELETLYLAAMMGGGDFEEGPWEEGPWGDGPWNEGPWDEGHWGDEMGHPEMSGAAPWADALPEGYVPILVHIDDLAELGDRGMADHGEMPGAAQGAAQGTAPNGSAEAEQ